MSSLTSMMKGKQSPLFLLTLFVHFLIFLPWLCMGSYQSGSNQEELDQPPVILPSSSLSVASAAPSSASASTSHFRQTTTIRRASSSSKELPYIRNDDSDELPLLEESVVNEEEDYHKRGILKLGDGSFHNYHGASYLSENCTNMMMMKDDESFKSGERLSDRKNFRSSSCNSKCEFGQTINDSVITLGLLSPYNHNRLSLGAMRLAVERVNNDPNLLPGRTLRYITADIGSSDLLPIKVMTEMRDRGTLGFIGGPEDTCVSEALVAAAWNLPMISYKCSDHRVSEKNTYRTFARTLPPSSKVSKSVVALLKTFNWNKIVLVVCHMKKDRWYNLIIEAFRKLGKEHNITITDHYSLPDYVPEMMNQMEEIVEKSISRTRVYVFIGEHVALVQLVRTLAIKRAFDKGKYVVISIDDKLNLTKGRFFDVEYLAPYLGNKTEENIEEEKISYEDMMKAYKSVLKLIPSNHTGSFGSDIKDLILNYSTGYPFCSPFHPQIFGDAQIPVEAAYLYDAVMIYAHALHEVLESGLDPRNGTAVFERIRNRSYHSLQGYDVFMDENGDAEGNYTVVSFLPVQEEEYGYWNHSLYDYWNPESNTTEFYSMQPVGYFAQVSHHQPSPHLSSTASPPSSIMPSSSLESPPGSDPDQQSPPGYYVTPTFEDLPGNHSNSSFSLTWNKTSLLSLNGNNHFSNAYDVHEDAHDKVETPAEDIAQAFRYFTESRPIQWVSGRPPLAEPKCGFKNEHCVYKPDWGTISVCSIAAAVLAVAFVMVGRHYRYEQKLACLLWKIDMQHVILISSGPPEPVNGTKGTVSICRQLMGTTVETEPPLEVPCKKAYTRIGFYKGMVVAVKPIYKKSIDLTRNIRKELIQIREVRHENIIPFIGASVDHGNICILTAYSARGSLEDVLQNEDLHLDNMFLASLVADLIKGMIYLHESEIISHGNLKSSNCLVDSRWVLQIADFGLHEFKAGQENKGNSEKEMRKLLWRAPELLRDPNPPARGTQKGDVYSFGIVLYEMIGRFGPWGKTQLSTTEIIDKVTTPELVDASESDNGYLRPSTLLLDCGESILKCLEACWEEESELRPDFRFIRMRLKEMQAGLKPNIFDNMLSIMEKYACNLEDLVQERTIQLMEEKKKTDALLHRMLPKSVAEALKRGDPVEAESFDSVTIYFSDIVGFTALSAVSTPLQVVELLNDLYTCFDSIISNYDVYKVETIGDAYMVVSGLPIRNGNQHAGEIASMALHLLERIKSFEIRYRPGERLKLRIGIHTGCVVAGVVGLKMPRYCLFGDTVNTASRMESSGEALKVHISNVTKSVLEQIGGYYYEERGIIPIKGKGEMRTFWLTGEDPSRTRKNSTESTATLLSDKGDVMYQSPGNQSPPKSGVIGFGQEGVDYTFDLNDVAATVTNNNFNKAFTCENASECHANTNQGFSTNEIIANESMQGEGNCMKMKAVGCTSQDDDGGGGGRSPTKETCSIDLSPTTATKGSKPEPTGNNNTVMMANGKLGYKPSAWLLAECQYGKVDHHGNLLKNIGGKYVSCSNVFQDCKVNIIKELKKNGNTTAAAAAAAFAASNGRNGSHLHQHCLHPSRGQSSTNRFRSAPIITFMETSSPNPGSTPLFAFEEREFV